jgi:hypothetical protein
MIQHLQERLHKQPLPQSGANSFSSSLSSSSSSSSSVASNRSDVRGGGDGAGDSKTALSHLAKTIKSLQRNVDALPPLPPVWQRRRSDTNSSSNNNNNNKTNDETSTTRLRRREILHSARSLVQEMQQMLDRGVLDPNKQFSGEMSVILERILKIYSQCQPDSEEDDDEDDNATNTGTDEKNKKHIKNNRSIKIPSVFDECQKVLHLFQQHPRLQNRRQGGHDLCVMLAAANEQKWQEASDLFLACISPDQAGYCPFDVDISNPVPLYAVARHAQQYQTNTVVENVMDAVHQMTLVSPMDEERYILAAGTALGLAGECRALVHYLERKSSLGHSSYSSSSKSSQQPLVAATMQACLLCHQPEQAMQVFDACFGHEQARAASEWLYAGGQDCMSPLCRDLAMRALGACASNESTRQQQQQQQHNGDDDMVVKAATAQDQYNGDWSATRALDYYRDAKAQGMTISLQALQGVVLACECDGKWQEAVELLLSVLSLSSTRGNQNSDNTAAGAAAASKSWIVRGEELDIQSLSEGAVIPYVPDFQQKLVPILETTMRACNAAGHYGISMLCLRLWSMSLIFEDDKPDSSMSLVDSLAPLMMVGNQGGASDSLAHDSAVATTTCLLRTTMVSLCGVQCTQEAARLYEAVIAMAGSQDICHDGKDIYDFAQSPETRFAGLSAMATTPPWEMVDLDMQKLFAILNRQAQRHDEAFQGSTQRQEQLLLQSSVAAQSLRHCTNLGQPLAGIYWLASLHGDNEEISRVTLDIPSLVQHLHWNNGGKSADSSKLFLTDSLLSSVMEAYSAMHEPSLALELFEAQIGYGQVQPDWVLSKNVVLDALFACNRDQNAMVMVEDALTTSACNPDTFSIAARWMSTRRDFSKVENIYREALSTGGGAYISESLCLQVLKAVSEERDRSAIVKIRILRTILDEVAKLMGMTTSDWIESRYWDLKAHLQFYDLKSLLWWEDPGTAFLDELDLAVGVFDKRKEMSLTPKHEAVRTIVKVAKYYHDDMIPLDKTRIPRVPRNLQDWNNLMTRVLREAEGTSLLQDPQFVEDAATALRRLGQEDAAVAWRRQVYLGTMSESVSGF